jgi:hypothetical protein
MAQLLPFQSILFTTKIFFCQEEGIITKLAAQAAEPVIKTARHLGRLPIKESHTAVNGLETDGHNRSPRKRTSPVTVTSQPVRNINKLATFPVQSCPATGSFIFNNQLKNCY